MSIENQNFELKAKPNKTTLSDRNYLIRNQVKPKYLTHDIVVDYIKSVIIDEKIKKLILIKLKKCPDGALQFFLDNIENKITEAIASMSPENKKNDLQQKPKEITIADMNAMRNSLSEQSGKEFENESSPNWNCLWW